MKELFIHIGYAKCATTFLQNRFFPAVNGLNYLGRYYGSKDRDYMPMDWVYDLSLKENYEPSKIINLLNQHSNGHQKSLLSHEALLRPYKVEMMLERLKKISLEFEKTSIIVSVRKQSKLVLSRYIHDIQISHFNAQLQDSIDFEGNSTCRWPVCSNNGNRLMNTIKNALPILGSCTCRKKGYKPINLPYYNYHHLLSLVSDVFGKENLHFILTENLRTDPARELGRLSNFIGIAPLDHIHIEKISNNEENVTKELKVNRKMLEEEKIMVAVEEYFKSSNRLLEKEMALDLKSLGYY